MVSTIRLHDVVINTVRLHEDIVSCCYAIFNLGAKTSGLHTDVFMSLE